MRENDSAQAAPPDAQLMEMIMAQLVSRLIHLAATLRLSDHLSDGPKSAEELAALTGTHAQSLYRVLRTLCMLGFFMEDATHRFSLTPLGATLKSGTPTHAAAVILGGEIITRSLDHLLHSVQTGETGFQKSYGTSVFEWFGEHPTEASLFNQTMVGVHGKEPAAVAAAYDFSQLKTLADIGGSTGNLLCTILERQPGPRGILFDLPHVAREASAVVRQRGLADRIRIEAGSFLENVPAGADAYLLSHVIHDWSEEQCLTILGHCRRAMKPNAKLLLVEMVLPEGNAPHPGKMLDIVMLVAPGGRERTAQEYDALLAKAGFRLTRVVPTASPVSVVEAVPR